MLERAHSVRNLPASAPKNNGSEMDAMRLAIPRRGHVLSTVVETYGKPIREAVAILASSFTREQCSEVRLAFPSPRAEQPESDYARADEELAAWAVVSMWVVGIAVKAFPATGTLSEAEQWFSESESVTTLLSAHAMRRAEAALRTEAEASAYFQLMPYVLDPHGPGSRLSVRRDPETHSARSRKRAEGVFYTPVDVAEYMTSACLAEISDETLPSIFDPACGTGVFLRAALQEMQRRYPARDAFSLASECLFGIDIDPWVLDAAAFVLVADSWDHLQANGIVPANAWRRLRMNLACIDTLRVDPATSIIQEDGKSLRKGGRVSISRLFPTMELGPMVVLGNPPYADLGRRSDLGELRKAYQTLAVRPHPNAEIYLPFIEQMIRLANKEVCSGALVLPLSVACNVGPQFSVARELISKTRGRWRFAFFDREPHALFGEDVKTRNAIVLWSRNPSNPRPILSTGPLQKWRGDSRAEMFTNLRFTVVDGDIRAGIPKIEGGQQASALRTLSRQWGCLEQVVYAIGRIGLAETVGVDDRTVFIGSTAYNFLNVFLKPPEGVLHDGQILSENPLHAVRCASRTDALAVFGILSSYLAYWWWHTHGDGFHVSRHFIAKLPFGVADFLEGVTGTLSKHGEELWAAIKEKPIISLNRGRTSLAYTPNGHDEIRRRIDEVLVNRVGLEMAFVDELQKFTTHTVAATVRADVMMETEKEENT